MTLHVGIHDENGFMVIVSILNKWFVGLPGQAEANMGRAPLSVSLLLYLRTNSLQLSNKLKSLENVVSNT